MVVGGFRFKHCGFSFCKTLGFSNKPKKSLKMSKTKWTLAEEEALVAIIGGKTSPTYTYAELGELNVYNRDPDRTVTEYRVTILRSLSIVRLTELLTNTKRIPSYSYCLIDTNRSPRCCRARFRGL